MTDEFGPDVPQEELPPEVKEQLLNEVDEAAKEWQQSYTLQPEHPVVQLLQESAETFKQRAEVYGDNYKKFGQTIMALGAELNLRNVHDWNRFGVFMQIVAKLTRYAENFSKGGHDDSLKDLAVYATMLRHLDKEMNEVPF